MNDQVIEINHKLEALGGHDLKALEQSLRETADTVSALQLALGKDPRTASDIRAQLTALAETSTHSAKEAGAIRDKINGLQRLIVEPSTSALSSDLPAAAGSASQIRQEVHETAEKVSTATQTVQSAMAAASSSAVAVSSELASMNRLVTEDGGAKYQLEAAIKPISDFRTAVENAKLGAAAQRLAGCSSYLEKVAAYTGKCASDRLADAQAKCETPPDAAECGK